MSDCVFTQTSESEKTDASTQTTNADEEDIYISFITSIKLCGGYIDFKYRVKFYIEQISKNCKKMGIPFEILICEDICEKNVEFLKDFFSNEFLIEHNTQLFERKQDYPNPREHNMLESHNKNLCMMKSRGKYLCCTNADVLMSDEFFKILPQLNSGSFYRFLSFEVEKLDKPWRDCDLEYYIRYCENNTLRCYNANLQDCPRLSDIAYKSGDIMLMHRDLWFKIKGFPENGCFCHADYGVCIVVENNSIPIRYFPEPVKVYTLQHSRSSHISDENKKNKLTIEEISDVEARICMELRRLHCLTCN